MLYVLSKFLVAQTGDTGDPRRIIHFLVWANFFGYLLDYYKVDDPDDIFVTIIKK